MSLLHKKKEKRLLFLKILVSVFAVIGGLGLLWTTTFSMPDLSNFEERHVEQSTKIYDRTGEHLLYDLHGDVKRTVVKFEDMSRYIKNATIAIEDDSFYTHKGIKPGAILRAVFVNIKEGGFSQGGSTITQQVVKNSLLTNEKTITRKIKEWILALKIERMLTKEEILELYLNEVPYGGNVYGIEEAARRFFNKSAQDLTLTESAYLAALPQAPTYYSPYGNNIEALENRKNTVLRRTRDLDFITEEEYQEALSTEVTFEDQADYGIHAPHFVFFIREYLEEKYGAREISEAGFKIVTTLDYELQEKAEDIVKRYALENSTKFNAENAALVAVDPLTGQILVMVGSRDYFDEEIPGKFNIALAHRQPGSAFKPFVYATAFKEGYTPETVVYDVKTQFSTACAASNLTSDNGCYSPGNYDNIFRGPMTFRNALAQSVNIPAVKALYLAGLQESLRTARDMGIRSLEDVDRYGLTLVLGGGEVSLLDITSAYGVFANEGERYEYTGILRIEDRDGNVIEEFEPSGEQVLDRNVARQITDVLSDNEARTPAFGANSYLHFPGRDVAAKTGTTNDYRDAWIVGYSPTIAAGAWAGNNDNSPMEKRVAGFIIAPLWNEFMQAALEKYPGGRFRSAPPIEEDLHPILQGHIGELPSHHTILYWINRHNPRGGGNSRSDAQFPLWEWGVQNWATGAPGGLVGGGADNDVTISGLESEYKPTERVRFVLAGSIQSAAITVGGTSIESRSERPWEFSFKPTEFNIEPGRHTLSISVILEDNSVHTLTRTLDIVN